MHPVHASVSQLRVTLWHAATRWLCPLSQTVSVVCAVHVSCGPGGCLACRGGPFMLCPPAGFTSDGPCTCWWTFRGSRQLGSYDCTRPKSCGARFGCCACFEAAACACPRGGGVACFRLQLPKLGGAGVMSREAPHTCCLTLAPLWAALEFISGSELLSSARMCCAACLSTGKTTASPTTMLCEQLSAPHCTAQTNLHAFKACLPLNKLCAC